MSIQKRFTAQDLERIKSAVRKAEERISGEILPVFVEKSDMYFVAFYRGFLAFAALTFLSIILFDRYSGYFEDLAVYDPMMIFLWVVMVGLLGALITRLAYPLRRLLIGRSELDRATRQRAENAFLEEEVFATRHRTGIMIFVSFFEREVIVMADRGISKVVEQKEWDKMVRGITENIRKGKVVEGMEAAILRSGEILLEKGFVKTKDDVNELRDDLRME